MGKVIADKVEKKQVVGDGENYEAGGIWSVSYWSH